MEAIDIRPTWISGHSIQDRIESDIQINDYNNRKELFSAVDKIIYDEIFDKLDERLYSTSKNWVSYGTWRITLWVNSCHFGGDIAERLNKLYYITHDEDKTGSLEDFADDICDEIQDWACDYWNAESWKEEE